MESAFRKMKVDITQGNWSWYEQAIMDFLSIPKRKVTEFKEEFLANVAGTYINRDLHISIEIAIHVGQLFMKQHGGAEKKTIYMGENQFYLDDISTELYFQRIREPGSYPSRAMLCVSIHRPSQALSFKGKRKKRQIH
ncbi:hypothetical protein [Peribacillus deserti]|uniref:Uncharacterized protein n=1 Tax=Peribacillus deserti TaxID=673318 RepID=A0A2N5MAY2_9BACI|nr:hypothetical protein [Peribacillus deserti]PLT31510.1 hypothetical protein CUU66_02130 [Peribacillus deserti]